MTGQRNMESEGHPVGTTEFGKGSPASDGWHDAVCAEIVDLGVDYTFQKKGERRGAIVCQLDETYDSGEFEGKRKEGIIWFSYDTGLGSSEKGTKLRKFLEGWRGKEFSAAEMEAMKTTPFQLSKLVGKPVRLFTMQTQAKQSDKMLTVVLKAEKAGPVKLQVEDYTPWHQRERGDRKQNAKQQQQSSAHSNGRGDAADVEPWDEPSSGGYAGPTQQQQPDDDEAPW